MERKEVFEKTAAVIAEVMGVDANIITEATGFEDLNADSLDVVELITAMEDEYDIIITDEWIRELFTVGEVAEFLENLIQK